MPHRQTEGSGAYPLACEMGPVHLWSSPWAWEFDGREAMAASIASPLLLNFCTHEESYRLDNVMALSAIDQASTQLNPAQGIRLVHRTGLVCGWI